MDKPGPGQYEAASMQALSSVQKLDLTHLLQLDQWDAIDLRSSTSNTTP